MAVKCSEGEFNRPPRYSGIVGYWSSFGVRNPRIVDTIGYSESFDSSHFTTLGPKNKGFLMLGSDHDEAIALLISGANPVLARRPIFASPQASLKKTDLGDPQVNYEV